MPPKADKKEKALKGDEAHVQKVLEYMQSVNRPYACTDVSNNLKGAVPKALAQKILVALAEKGSLTMKPYGKQTIFVFNQSNLSVLDAEEVATLDAEVKEAQGELEAYRKDLKALQSELQAKESQPKTSELSREIARVKAENETSLKTLLLYRGVDAPPALSVADTKLIDDGWNKWRKEWTNRRKVYRELLGVLGDGGAYINKIEFEEAQEIEQDDDDAIAVEQGEFCAPPVVARRPVPKAAAKRSPTPAEGQVRKKSKK
ncbi:hypothetical protein Q5752_006558 [Cryptotrichosporon argae]